MRKKTLKVVLVCLLFISLIGGCTKEKHKEKPNGINSEKDKPVFVDKGKKHPRLNKEKLKAFKGLDMDKETLKLSMEGKDLDLVMPIHINTNRFYLPLNEIVDDLEGDIEDSDKDLTINLNNKNFIINIKDMTYEVDGQTFKFSKSIYQSEGFTYVSLFDFAKMLDLKTDWDYKNKKIAMFKNRERIEKKEIKKTEKPALIRLEDIAAGSTYRYVNEGDLYKLRIMADYLYGEGIPFHVAWVPRYVDPRPGAQIDNDLTKQNTMYNSDFLFTLDYFNDRNGLIGLHGYTHQFGKDASVDGFEFAHKSAPGTKEYAEERVELAKETAKKLNVPTYFFELPHYSGSPTQLKVLENHFEYIYNPYSPKGREGQTYVIKIKNGEKESKYIPTPLDYIDGPGDTNNMINKVKRLPDGVMASFFYHPSIEFGYINITKGADGYPSYNYSDQSPMRRVIKEIMDRGYSFKKVSEL